MQKWSFPETYPSDANPNGFAVRWVFDTEKSESGERLDAAAKVIGAGVTLKADEVRSAAGFSKPGPGDETVGGPQPAVPGQGPPGQPSPELLAGAAGAETFERGMTPQHYVWVESEHQRAVDGKFEKGGRPKKDANKQTEKRPASSQSADGHDVDANRPSRPENRHEGAAPPKKPYREPPPKKGVKGSGPAKRPKGDASQTALGDHTEEIAKQLGFRSILPAGKRTAAGTVDKHGSIDLEYDHSGKAYELKMCKTTSTEYRLKAKASEKDHKMAYAKKYNLTPHTLIGVRDVDKNEVHFYGSKEPGFTGAEVSEKHFDYLGTVKF
jgi:hypothetical protein